MNRHHIQIGSDVLKTIYPHNVQVYVEELEIGTVPTVQFEQLALSRLRLYKIIQNASNNGHARYSFEWTQCIIQSLGNSDLCFSILCEREANLDNPTELEVQARKMDHISHFILRLACSDIKLRRWFIRNEVDWLYIRYQQQTARGRKVFMQLNHLNYHPIYDYEKRDLWEYLKDLTENQDFSENVYKLKLKEALSLIKYRQVHLQHGDVFVPESQLVFCIISGFKRFLNRILHHINLNIDLMDDRLKFHIEVIQQTISVGGFFTDSSNKRFSVDVEPSKLNKYARKNFPLCMKHLYKVLKTDHHLKYGARLQLGGFIKNIGISLEDSLKFWKSEFTHKITDSAFEKNYAYHIKHTYGTVGRMAEYTPESCQNIICCKQAPGEIHGCPFKAWDSSYLREKLEEDGLSRRDIGTIVEETRNQRYEIACTKYFEYKHGTCKKEPVKYPHEYFRESLTLTGCNGESSDENDEETRCTASTFTQL